MQLSDLLEEIIEQGGCWEKPEFVKLKDVDVNLGGSELHTATALFYHELMGNSHFKITIECVDYNG